MTFLQLGYLTLRLSMHAGPLITNHTSALFATITSYYIHSQFVDHRSVIMKQQGFVVYEKAYEITNYDENLNNCMPSVAK